MKLSMEAQKEHFKDHVAHFKDYGDIKVIDFYNPNSSAYRIRFLFDESIYTLHITDDLGNLTASNYKNMNYADFYKHFCRNPRYFEGKIVCCSRALYEWDYDKARKELEDYFHNGFDEDEKLDEDEIEEKIEDILEFFDSRKGISERGYEALSEVMPDAFEYVDDLGKEETGVLDLYLLAFELAYKQLNPDKVNEGRSVNDKIPFKSETPLMLAIVNKQWEVVRFLIENGADLLAVDGEGNTPLNVSVSSNINAPEDIIKALIKLETLNKDNCFGQTPLYKAILTNNPVAVKVLLETGADCSSEFNNGLTPMMLALKFGNVECARELQKLGFELELPPEQLNTIDDELVEAVDVEE